jgi:hypothetical protein
MRNDSGDFFVCGGVTVTLAGERFYVGVDTYHERLCKLSRGGICTCEFRIDDPVRDEKGKSNAT